MTIFISLVIIVLLIYMCIKKKRFIIYGILMLIPFLVKDVSAIYKDYICGLMVYIIPIEICIFVKRKKYKNRLNKYKETEYAKETNYNFDEIENDLGKSGEFKIYEQLEKIGDYKKFIFNAYIPKEHNETSEVDLIMIHETGIYVFESKNFKGYIYGSENQKQWYQTLARGRDGIEKNSFYNPIKQNLGHIHHLKKYLSDYSGLELRFFSIIVFSNYADFINIDIKDKRNIVIHVGETFNTINGLISKGKRCLNKSQIDLLYYRLLSVSKASEYLKEKHIDEIKNKQ